MRIAQIKNGEANRKADIKINRQEYAKRQKEKKGETRKVNIEIASELVDLLMDMSSEAFDLMKSRPNKKLQKEDWRGFMNIFEEGKKVSLRNVVKKDLGEDGTGESD